MEGLIRVFAPCFNVVRLDLERDSFYLVEDSESRCYLMPSWACGLFPTWKDPWLNYRVSGRVYSCLADDAGGEWLKRDGVWL